MWEQPLDRPAKNQSDFSSAPLVDSPSRQLRWVCSIAVMIPMLLATGVYWLHHISSKSGSAATDNLLEIHLVDPGSRMERPLQTVGAPPPPSPPRTDPPSEEHLASQEQGRKEPEAVAAPTPPALTPPPPAVMSTSPGASIPTVRKATSRTASAFQRALFTHIARFQNYPEEARRNRTQGTVQILFTMQRDGVVTDVQIQESSGHSDLDAAAVDTIRRAQPLPAIPSDLPDDLSILMPVAFEMP
jgi:periplasmic protein TonB